MALFITLWGVAARGNDEQSNNTLVLDIPKEIIADHRPAISLSEREKRRRRLLNEVFILGLSARREVEHKQERDQDLSRAPYYVNDSNKIIYDRKL